LGMIKPDEVFYQVIEKPATAAPITPPPVVK
jgi:hypothetical protein